MSYTEASQNFYGSWTNPKHFNDNIQQFKSTMAFLHDATKLPAEKMTTAMVSKRYSLLKTYNDGHYFVIKYDPFFGHTVLDSMPWIFFMARNRPDVTILILSGEYNSRQKYDVDNSSDPERKQLKKKSEKTVFDFLLKILDRMDAKYEVVNLDPLSFIVVNHAMTVVNGPTEYGRHSAVASMVETIKEMVLDGSERPTKIVYASRQKVSIDDFVSNTAEADKKLRIINEQLFEKFLEGLGFEIVYPEDFDSFEDQIKFFANVKTFAGSTTSGMNNQLWMHSGGTIIEFATPIYLGDHFELHTHYQAIANFKGHNFIRIPVVKKDAVDIINNINNNRHLRSLLENL